MCIVYIVNKYEFTSIQPSLCHLDKYSYSVTKSRSYYLNMSLKHHGNVHNESKTCDPKVVKSNKLVEYLV